VLFACVRRLQQWFPTSFARAYPTHGCIPLLITSKTMIAPQVVTKTCTLNLFFIRWSISVIFAEKFWSLKHFGHLSHSGITTRRSSVFSLYFQTFWNDLILLVILKSFRFVTEKNSIRLHICNNLKENPVKWNSKICARSLPIGLNAPTPLKR